MKRTRTLAIAIGSGAAIIVAAIASCGGGGGGGSETRFNGNVSSTQALLQPAPAPETALARWSFGFIGTAYAQVTGVQICLQGSSTICTTTIDDGSFSLPVEGDLVDPCLTFTGQNFTANLCLAGTFPTGSVITLHDIDCDISTDTCTAEDVDVDEPSDAEPSEPSAEGVSDPSEPSEPSPDDDGEEVSDAGDDDVSGPEND